SARPFTEATAKFWTTTMWSRASCCCGRARKPTPRYDTGGMRRTHLRGHQNILKRLLIHVGAFNLSLIFHTLLGSGTPRELKNRQSSHIWYFLLFRRSSASARRTHYSFSSSRLRRPRNHRYLRYKFRHAKEQGCVTDC